MNNIRKKSNLKLVILIAALLLYKLSFSQEISNSDTLSYDIAFVLPPLEVLIDSAINNNSEIELLNQSVIIGETRLVSKKKEWTKTIGIQANAGYGNLLSYTNTASGSMDPLLVGSSRNQTQYNAALYLNLPLSTFADRKNQINLAKAEKRKSELDIEAKKTEIRKEVILAYNRLILSKKLLVLKARNLESIKLRMQMTDNEFINGVSSLTELTNITISLSDAESNLEVARIEFLNAFMMLEEITGLKFDFFTNTP
jgi:outer membrane protein TolC